MMEKVIWKQIKKSDSKIILENELCLGYFNGNKIGLQAGVL